MGLIKAQLAAVQIELAFYDAIDAFGQCIFIRIAVLCHANRYSGSVERADILFTTVLSAPVGMMDQRLMWIGSVTQSHLQSRYAPLGQHIAAKAEADDLT